MNPEYFGRFLDGVINDFCFEVKHHLNSLQAENLTVKPDRSPEDALKFNLDYHIDALYFSIYTMKVRLQGMLFELKNTNYIESVHIQAQIEKFDKITHGILDSLRKMGKLDNREVSHAKI